MDPHQYWDDLHARSVPVAQQAIAAALAEPRTPESIDGAMRAAFAFGEYVARLVSRNGSSRPKTACAKGCGTCCHVAVNVTAAEVLFIVAVLRSKLSKEAFDELRARVATLDDKTHGTFGAERGPHPCIFLDDDACSIHAIRPLICRMFTSTDVGQCARWIDDRSTVLQSDPFERAIHGAAVVGLAQAIGGIGLVPGDLEMTAALRAAMSEPDAAERWLAGEAVFADCAVNRRNAKVRLTVVS